LNNHHNGRIMASRIFALIIWAAVAASLAYWGLRWLARPTGVPANATPVSMDGGTKGDIHRLLAGPTKASKDANQVNPGLASMLSGRIKLLGVIAPRAGEQTAGIALLSVDGKPPRAFRLGATVDGEMVLQSLTQRGAQIGPANGPAAINLDLPMMPGPNTGALPPVASLTPAKPNAAGAPGMAPAVTPTGGNTPPPPGAPVMDGAGPTGRPPQPGSAGS